MRSRVLNNLFDTRHDLPANSPPGNFSIPALDGLTHSFKVINIVFNCAHDFTASVRGFAFVTGGVPAELQALISQLDGLGACAKLW